MSSYQQHWSSICPGYRLREGSLNFFLISACMPDYAIHPGKRPLPGKCPCTEFQWVSVAASIQMYGSYILGKYQCGPKSQVMLRWAVTRDTMICENNGQIIGNNRYIYLELITRGAKREGTVIVLKPDVC